MIDFIMKVEISYIQFIMDLITLNNIFIYFMP